jgi:hypothetical protein
MQNNDKREPSENALDPIDRCSEILFGLIMAVTIVGGLSIAHPNDGVRPVLAAALGCNIAWGLVDAVMHLLRTVVERLRLRDMARKIIASDAGAGHLLIQDALPPGIVAITTPTELEAMRQRLLALSGTVMRPVVGWADIGTAIRIYLLVVIATFPVVVPFLFTDNLALALKASRAVTLAMLFAAGWALGRYAGYAHPARAGLFAAVFGVVLILSVMALGG